MLTVCCSPYPWVNSSDWGHKSPKELLFMLSMVSQKSKVRSISKFYDRCKSICQNVFDAQQYGIDYSWEHYTVNCTMYTILYYTLNCLLYGILSTLYSFLNTLLSWVHNNSSLVPGTGRESTMSSQLDRKMNS